MPYRLQPHVAGQLGEMSDLDTSVHPPVAHKVHYVLDGPRVDAIVESFPVFLVERRLAAAMTDAGLTGFDVGPATVTPSEEYLAVQGDVPVPDMVWLQVRGTPEHDCWIDDTHVLCVSERMLRLVEATGPEDCDVEEFGHTP